MKENGKTVVVVGSDGYLGHALTIRLLFGGYRVAAIDDFQRRKHVKQMNSFSAIDIGEPEDRLNVLKKHHFDFLEADISKEYDMDQVEDFLEFCEPVAVVNLAQQPSAPFSLKSREHAVDTTRNNLLGTLNILYWMKEHAPKAQLIQIGSMGEYDPAAGTDIPEGVFDLDYRGRIGRNMIFPRRPGSFYHASKVASTYYIDCACRWWGLKATDIMQGVVYGNHSPEMDEIGLPTRLDSDEAFGTVINRFAVQAVLGVPLTVFGDGMQRRGYLSVSDSIQCLMLAIENPPVDGEYRTWNQLDTVYTVVELAHIVKSVCHLPVEIQHIPTPRAERTDSFYYKPYTEKLKYLGFEPQRTIEQEVDYMIRKLVPIASDLFPLENVVTPKSSGNNMGRGSVRYKNMMSKIRGKAIIGSGLNMPRRNNYESFNITPGMSSWRDMPENYKKQYAAHAQVLDQNETKQKEEEMQKKLVEIERRIEESKVTVDEVFLRRKKKPMAMEFDRSVSNFIDDKFFSAADYEITTTPRARILLISDVKGWAWWNKSNYLKKYLSDEFSFDIINALESHPKIEDKYDLYVTYGYSYVGMTVSAPKHRRITGITAHRPLEVLKPYMHKAKYLHANSLLLLKELESMADKSFQKCYYVPNGVDEVLFREQLPIKKDGPLIAGHVGKKCPAKGQDEFILPAINASGVESMYNMKDYRNRLPYTEMWKMYQAMDVFVIASIEDGTPNGALEAAACGRPIISNRIGNMPEFIKDGYNGFIVDRNVDAYVDRLKYLSNNRDKLIEMGKNARKTIEEGWTWKHQSEHWRTLFRDILATNGRKKD